MNSQVKAAMELTDRKKSIFCATFSVNRLIQTHTRTICTDSKALIAKVFFSFKVYLLRGQ